MAVAVAAAGLIRHWTRQSWNRLSGSRVSVSDPVFDPVLSFNMRVYRGVVSTE